MAIILRRVALALALAGAVVCVILLLNFTAPNPTGRRYSSDSPPETNGNNSQEAGASAEDILSRDLGVARNSVRQQKQCICPPGKETPVYCGSCMIHTSLPPGKRYMLPDFIGKDFIIEAKHRMTVDGSHLRQLTIYAYAAQAQNLELWLFVDIGAKVDPRYYDLVEDTGGRIVYYFTAPGYTDPTDRAATAGLIVCVPVGLALLFWEFRPRRIVIIRRTPAPRLPPRNKVDEAELFRDTMKEKARLRLDQVDHE